MRTVKKMCRATFFGCMLLCWSGLALSADWAIYYEDGMEMHRYDRSSVERPRKGVVQVVIQTTVLGDQQGLVRRLEMDCTSHSFRNLSGRVDPVTGVFEPQGAAGGYKWTWFPLESRMMALYENLCE
jgi:hypothetical protein